MNSADDEMMIMTMTIIIMHDYNDDGDDESLMIRSMIILHMMGIKIADKILKVHTDPFSLLK